MQKCTVSSPDTPRLSQLVNEDDDDDVCINSTSGVKADRKDVVGDVQEAFNRRLATLVLLHFHGKISSVDLEVEFVLLRRHGAEKNTVDLFDRAVVRDRTASYSSSPMDQQRKNVDDLQVSRHLAGDWLEYWKHESGMHVVRARTTCIDIISIIVRSW